MADIEILDEHFQYTGCIATREEKYVLVFLEVDCVDSDSSDEEDNGDCPMSNQILILDIENNLTRKSKIKYPLKGSHRVLLVDDHS